MKHLVYSIFTLVSSVSALNVVKFKTHQAHDSRLEQRASINSMIDNVETNYNINLTIGTPPQPLTLFLDTGSTDLWVNTKQSAYCSSSEDPCVGGTFDITASSSYKVSLPGQFDIAYGDGSTATGDYSTDDVTIDGVTITNQTIGIALQNHDNPHGLLGIGIDINEAICSNSTTANLPCNTSYLSFIDNLAIQKRINSRAYSLWLDDKTSGTGTLLFGGIDTSKYMGNLMALPMVPDIAISTTEKPYYRELQVAWVGLSVDSGGRSQALFDSSYAIRALLDSGTTLTQIPQAAFNQVQAILGLEPISNRPGSYAVNCSLANADTTFNFTFGSHTGGKTINVAASEFVRQPLDANLSNGAPACRFGMQAQSDPNQSILGDTFMRSAYIVYDLDNKEIALAQANFKPGQSNVQEISAAGVNAIPNVASTASLESIAPVASATAGSSPTHSSSSSAGTSTHGLISMHVIAVILSTVFLCTASGAILL